MVQNEYFGTVTGFPSDEITALACDHQGIVYVGTKDTGLVIIPPRSHQWSHIVDESHSLSFNAIHSLRLDRKTHLLVGTAGGLNDIDLSDFRPSSKLFAEDGLKDNIVMSVVRDPNGSTL
ncbi:MAG TPA: two-component regulator propeller domain-containing protein, partial [Candidatus Ozemobacteraceae bacterium]|nr:two-component regulator propeller domain-containing protein [Candidatus Ozemobacteraceae bacterium]